MSPSTIGRILEPRRGRRIIDRRAWACLERCRRKLGLDEIPLPVPIEDWIEGPLNIRFGFTDLSHLGEDVLGAAYVTDREILIDGRVLSHEGRYRFTCAHELGHLVLHRRVRSIFQETSATGLFTSPDEYERQADRFAAAFLMPIPLVERELIRILDGHRLRRGRAFIYLMQPTVESEWLWRKVILPAFTKRFGVSYAAAVHRFSDIQPIIPNTQPLLPSSLVNVLTQPNQASDQLDSVWVEQGLPRVRDLFEPRPAAKEVV